MAVLLDRDLIMPIDTLFSLSSSPPISYLTATAYRFQRGNFRDFEQNLAVPTHSSPALGSSNLSLNDVNSLSNGMFTQSIKPTYNSSSKHSMRAAPKMLKESQPLRSCLRVKLTQNGDDGSLDSPESPTDPSSPTAILEEEIDKLRINDELNLQKSPKDEKKVVFADSKGLPLEDIKILDGPTDIPPSLSEELLKYITQDAKPEPEHPYTYVADFEQPASNYLEFRQRVENKCVSLENLMISENIKVLGTVKVKNIAFEKTVGVRVTFDEWKTSIDVPATFVPQSSNGGASRYDTFSFEFDVPPNQGGKQFEFCVNFEAANGQFWDNNEGNNYRIVSKERRGMTDQEKMVSYYTSLSGHHNWGEFSFWKVQDNQVPYW